MISPSHIAIIMDGNGRWGLKKYKDRNKGHYYGLQNINKIIKDCIKIKYLTLYTFSTENWNRPKKEIDYLFFLFKYFYKKNFNKLNKNNIKIKFIGNLKIIPKDLKVIIKKIQDKTKNNDAITVTFAFNYGAKSELVNAFKNIIKNKNKFNKINEDLINNNLYTKNIPDPDILIRTGGEKRLSNFLLWQLSYAELFFINKNWPDFNFFDLKKIINTFRVTKRKFGGLNE